MAEPIELLPPGTGPHDAIKIPLAGSGSPVLCALIDKDDYQTIRRWGWHLLASGPSLVYARAWMYGKRIMMHNLITGWPNVDHINGNGLDNRRCNLRASSHGQNMGNRRKGAIGSSRYKGVYSQPSGRWKAQIGIAGERVYLGLFDDEESAARAYDERAREPFGSFAALNFPREGENSCHR